jgi:hypothetical protein
LHRDMHLRQIEGSVPLRPTPAGQRRQTNVSKEKPKRKLPIIDRLKLI